MLLFFLSKKNRRNKVIFSIIPTKSEPYNGIGLKPDFIVELPADTSLEYITRESDTQLRKAIETLSSAIAEKE